MRLVTVMQEDRPLKVSLMEHDDGVSIIVDSYTIGKLTNNGQIYIYQQRGGRFFNNVHLRGPEGFVKTLWTWFK